MQYLIAFLIIATLTLQILMIKMLDSLNSEHKKHQEALQEHWNKLYDNIGEAVEGEQADLELISKEISEIKKALEKKQSKKKIIKIKESES